MNTRRIFVACRLTQGAFSGEALFEIDTLDGRTYEGLAPRRDCRNDDGSPVGEHDLPVEGTVPGKLVAHLIGNGGDVARVALPDGEAVIVSADLVSERESEIAHVSV